MRSVGLQKNDHLKVFRNQDPMVTSTAPVSCPFPSITPTDATDVPLFFYTSIFLPWDLRTPPSLDASNRRRGPPFVILLDRTMVPLANFERYYEKPMTMARIAYFPLALRLITLPYEERGE